MKPNEEIRVRATRAIVDHGDGDVIVVPSGMTGSAFQVFQHAAGRSRHQSFTLGVVWDAVILNERDNGGSTIATAWEDLRVPVDAVAYITPDDKEAR